MENLSQPFRTEPDLAAGWQTRPRAGYVVLQKVQPDADQNVLTLWTQRLDTQTRRREDRLLDRPIVRVTTAKPDGISVALTNNELLFPQTTRTDSACPGLLTLITDLPGLSLSLVANYHEDVLRKVRLINRSAALRPIKSMTQWRGISAKLTELANIYLESGAGRAFYPEAATGFWGEEATPGHPENFDQFGPPAKKRQFEAVTKDWTEEDINDAFRDIISVLQDCVIKLLPGSFPDIEKEQQNMTVATHIGRIIKAQLPAEFKNLRRSRDKVDRDHILIEILISQVGALVAAHQLDKAIHSGSTKHLNQRSPYDPVLRKQLKGSEIYAHPKPMIVPEKANCVAGYNYLMSESAHTLVAQFIKPSSLPDVSEVTFRRQVDIAEVKRLMASPESRRWEEALSLIKP